ncbi:MAG: hypothetical protein KAT05_12555 [Spirochaetes bacterium]|nr:hypothetical protein [Spirochaetota bacterium]
MPKTLDETPSKEVEKPASLRAKENNYFMNNRIIFNKPVKSLCAFIDILGYQNIVEDSYKNNKELELLENLKKIINEALRYMSR